jgi:hypothetical protein
MAIKPLDAFKFGFLLRCAEEGLEAPQLQERIKLAGAGTMALGAAGSTLGAGLGLSKFLLLGGIPALALGGGAGLGYLGAKMGERDIDPDEVKVNELIATYQQQADKLRRSGTRRRAELANANVPRGPRLFG